MQSYNYELFLESHKYLVIAGRTALNKTNNKRQYLSVRDDCVFLLMKHLRAIINVKFSVLSFLCVLTMYL